MYRFSKPLAVALLFGSGFAAWAEDPQANPVLVPDSAAAAAADCQEGKEDCKLECKHMAPPTGTRLGGHTECRTHKYWDDRMREDQARTNKIQQDAYKYARPGE